MIDVSGMKNIAMAAPWMSVGISSVHVSICVVKCERIQNTSANVRNADVATQRASIFGRFLPMTGERMMAKMPTGAMIRPASVAV